MHTLDDKLEPKAVRKLEIISGPGRRRTWTREEKARIVEESGKPPAKTAFRDLALWRALRSISSITRYARSPKAGR